MGLIMNTIAIANQKGGVGKTTITFNLAKCLAQKGYKVLAIDNDPQGNLTSAMLEDPTSLTANILSVYEEQGGLVPHTVSPNLDLIGATIRLSKVMDGGFETIYKLKEGVNSLKEQYDFMLVDSLPSFGYLNMAALNVAEYLLIPVEPGKFALEGMQDLFSTIDKMQKRLNPRLQVLGIILNKIDNTNITQITEKALRETYSNLVFKTMFSRRTKVKESPSFNQSITEYDPKGEPALQFNQFVKEFLERLGV